MLSLSDALSLYDYTLPSALVAQEPSRPRDSAKLLVYRRETQKIHDVQFRDIGRFLPPRSVLVLNETKVIPAKLTAVRASGGKIALLYLEHDGRYLRVLSNRRLRIGETLQLADDASLVVKSQDENVWLLEPSFSLSQLNLFLDRLGSAPLPPYIKRSPLSSDELRREYQSVFAREPGSIAAPTASLHFTQELLESLRDSGVRMARVTLHVHLGTFAPLTEEQWEQGRLHTEHYHMDGATVTLLEEAKSAHAPIIAVGTTVVRALESASDENGKVIHPSGTTNLFIRENYKFRLVEGLITNFHVPRSSLLMLVSALTGREKLMNLYRHAISRQYRFFSFGDAMMVL